MRSETERQKKPRLVTQSNGNIWVEWNTVSQMPRSPGNEILWKVHKTPICIGQDLHYFPGL